MSFLSLAVSVLSGLEMASELCYHLSGIYCRPLRSLQRIAKETSMPMTALQRAIESIARKQAAADWDPQAYVPRHNRKCTVCHHPHRESIEQDYLRWHSPQRIARDFLLPHYSSVYRHARAKGLLALRQKSIRASLENFIEQAESVRVTAASVIAAVRLYAQMNDSGELVKPPKARVIPSLPVKKPSADLASAPPTLPVPANAKPSAARKSRVTNPISNRKPKILEPHLSPSKSTNDPVLIANFQPTERARKSPSPKPRARSKIIPSAKMRPPSPKRRHQRIT
jgi:hypothetical protein